jgi:hypothetical protein
MIENRTKAETDINTLTTTRQKFATYTPGSEVWYIDRVEIWIEDYENPSGSERPIEISIEKVDPDNDSPIQGNRRPQILSITQNISPNATNEDRHIERSVGTYVTRTNLELIAYQDRTGMGGTLDILIHARRVQ